MNRKKQNIGSPAYQVKNALQRVFAPGRSRRADKAAGAADRYIYSIHTMRAYVEDGTRFAKWVRAKYGVRDIRHITPAHARAYLDHLAAKERSGGYLSRVKAAIGKLSWALHGERWGLGGVWHSDPRPDHRYFPAGARRIIADLRAPDVDVAQCAVCPDKGTKGGRPRTVAEIASFFAIISKRTERLPRNQIVGSPTTMKTILATADLLLELWPAGTWAPWPPRCRHGSSHSPGAGPDPRPERHRAGAAGRVRASYITCPARRQRQL